MFYIMFGLVVTTEAHLAYAGDRIHSNNTTEISSIVEALSFLVLHGCPGLTGDNATLPVADGTVKTLGGERRLRPPHFDQGSS